MLSPIQSVNNPTIQEISEKSAHKQLLIELWELIFYKLNCLDLQAASSVSKDWSVKVKIAAKNKEFFLFKLFIGNIDQHLNWIANNPDDFSEFNKYERELLDTFKTLQDVFRKKKIIEDVCNRLHVVAKDTKIPEFSGLQALKFSMLDLEEKLLNVLKSLDVDLIFKLALKCKNEFKPVSWDIDVYDRLKVKNPVIIYDHHCYLAFIYKSYHWGQSQNIFDGLLDHGFVDKAIMYVIETSHIEYLETISRKLNAAGYAKKETEVLEIINNFNETMY